MLFLIFVLETGVVIGHGLSPTPLFNVLAVIAYTGLIRIFLEKKWTMELATLKRWTFGLSGFYLILALIFGFFYGKSNSN